MTTDKAARKARPIARGVLGYFPDAIAEVAHVSFVGNKQHNGDAPMHWARGKSDDHADCAARHLIEAGTIDTDGLRHTAKLAWRALAMLQIELEEGGGEFEPTGPGQAVGVPIVNMAEFFRPNDGNPRRVRDYDQLLSLGCPPHVAAQIVAGTTYAPTGATGMELPYVYVAGPMRGYENFNFPAFDAARDAFVANGFNVISPADIDRAAGDVNATETKYTCTQADFAFRDFWANYLITRINDATNRNGIVLLKGWEKSMGAAGEFFLVRWFGTQVYRPDGTTYGVANATHDYALAWATAK